MEFFQVYWEERREVVVGGWETDGERHEVLLAAIALDFQTWRTLVRRQGLDEARAVGLTVGMVRCLMHT